ncbi:hypothetical protein F511_21669 [Dorcoceras hygrometricum]|uniref:Mucin-2-like n=1 Tax=Dorcoceras hygrometricum TaxID=472368 RepID=A0A2Z7B6L4_9LAMI|nr:hypothetical protein F511_21669 [Dorcoceras hygrometricum]
MASSHFINTLQVDFASILAVEHTGMIRMFKSLEYTGLRGFLEGTTSVFETAVTEFFVNARVIAGTIISTVCNRKMVVTEDIFSATFKLPIEGMTSLVDIPKETIVEMRRRFSATAVPFKAPSKKMEMQFEYRLLHDTVAKSLCAKNPKKQSQGYIVPVSILMETLVKADLGAFIKLHPQKVLTSKSVQSYIKKNQDIAPEGETSKRTKDTASNTEGSETQPTQPSVTESLTAKEKGVDKPTKRKATGEGTQRAMAGLPIVDEEVSFLESASSQPQLLSLEFYSLADQDQTTAQTRSHQIDQPENENTAMITLEHQAQENEPPDPYTLQFVDTTAQTLTVLSNRVSSLDLTCARIHDDTNLTWHHTTLLHEQIKNDVDGLDIKIDLVDEQALVKSQLAAMVESIKEFGADKKSDPEEKLSHFIEGLKPMFKMNVRLSVPRTYREAVDRALQIERDWKDLDEERQQKRQAFQQKDQRPFKK